MLADIHVDGTLVEQVGPREYPRDHDAGIDIGSRRDLLGHVRRFADEGGAVIVVSSELGDLGRIADRVVVLAHGAIIQMLDRDADDVLSEANLLTAIHQEAGVAA